MCGLDLWDELIAFAKVCLTISKGDVSEPVPAPISLLLAVVGSRSQDERGENERQLRPHQVVHLGDEKVNLV